MSQERRPRLAAPRFRSLAGILLGALGGLVYWVAAQFWPTSIAVILSMCATAGASADARTKLPGMLTVSIVFVLFVKYNALMALSGANLPFRAPTNVALGLVMIAGHAASRAVTISTQVSQLDHTIALVIGFAPAALMGMPGLIGLLAAIGVRIGYVAYIKRQREPAVLEPLDTTRQLAEVCFYLGALASWSYG